MLFDRVSFSTATAGAGTITAGAATSGFRTMAQASIPDGTSVEYAIEDGAAWETGTGVIGASATTLTRALSQSSTGALLVLTGAAKCFITPIATLLNALGKINPVLGRVRSSVNQSVAAGTVFIDVVWNAAPTQVNGTFWTTGATVTIPETGYYRIDTEGTFEGAAVTVTCNMQVIVNGAAIIGDDERMVAAGATAALMVSATRLFTAGDTVKVQVKHSNATALNLLTQGDHSPDIRVEKIGGVGGATPSGSTTQVQYNNAGAMAGAVDVMIDPTGHLIADEYIEQIVPPSTPTTPVANRARDFVRLIATRVLKAFVQPDGAVMTLQPHIARNRISMWQAVGNAVTITLDGAGAFTATGAATASNFATTNVYTQSRRVEALVTVAALTAVAGFFGTAALWFRGNAAFQGGFTFIDQWGPATGVATTTNRAFCGMTSSVTAPTDVEPSTLLNMVGMGWDAADANIQIMHNAGAGSATKVNLGASFPVPTTDRTKSYELTLHCGPNAASIGYTVEDMATGAIASGSLTTNLPVNTVALAPRRWMSVGGTSSVIGIAFMQSYLETER